MAEKKTPEEKLEMFDKLVGTLPDQKRKGKASAYTSHNGHMFSFLDKKSGELSLRFSEAGKKALMEKYGAKESIQHNSVMRGYIIVPEELFGDYDVLSELFKDSYEYINSLKPKPTNKKKK